MDSPYENMPLERITCPQCDAPAMSLVWEPAAPFATAQIGCSQSCGLVPGIPEPAARALAVLWQLSPFGVKTVCNADFKSKSESEGES